MVVFRLFFRTSRPISLFLSPSFQSISTERSTVFISQLFVFQLNVNFCSSSFFSRSLFLSNVWCGIMVRYYCIVQKNGWCSQIVWLLHRCTHQAMPIHGSNSYNERELWTNWTQTGNLNETKKIRRNWREMWNFLSSPIAAYQEKRKTNSQLQMEYDVHNFWFDSLWGIVHSRSQHSIAATPYLYLILGVCRFYFSSSFDFPLLQFFRENSQNCWKFSERIITLTSNKKKAMKNQNNWKDYWTRKKQENEIELNKNALNTLLFDLNVQQFNRRFDAIEMVPMCKNGLSIVK